MAVQAAVSERQGGVHRGLLDVGEQRRRDELAHVGGGGAEGHGGREVAGAGHRQEGRGDGLGDVACRLAGRHIQGQLVRDASSVALLAEAMLLFMAAVVGWFASLRSTEAGVLLPLTSTWRASRADWLALAARPTVKLVFTAARPEALAAREPSAAARSEARA